MDTYAKQERTEYPERTDRSWKANFLQSIQYLNISSISNGIIAWLFGATGPLLIVLQSAAKGHLGTIEVSSWIFSIYFVGGLLSILLSAYYRQPIAVAFSIPGAVLVGTTLAQHNFNEVIGAYIVTGLFILILGVTGVVGRIMNILPMPIMMGMVSGVLLPFGTDIFTSVLESPVLNGSTFAAFLVISSFPKIAKRVPPVLGAIAAAAILLVIMDLADLSRLTFSLASPQFFVPEFNAAAIGELVLPLALTVIAIQNAQGIGVLQSMGYKPPVDAMTNWSGIGSIVNGFLGAHSACIAGPMTAIVAGKDTGPVEGRYASGMVLGFLCLLFGIFAPLAASITQIIPASLIKLLGGLAMLGVLLSSFQMSFSARFKMGALFSFLITISGFNLLHIGAPFWGLIGGLVLSLLLERKDFQRNE
ncbi:benzoate/H(+) symporter BenE family transporter [Aneurinibacillus tyrosinisolvens]|uniref:benzoate/H(+) symporter BenE family transporter n=1 Tax=Aneurinibacillus tyrosinisolvens TaxID=1443435 RepID=UPI000699AE5D|nr:benzoate/H(+) symporter BenE family transporter [Aneurinibacillus tyrosinisolvens]